VHRIGQTRIKNTIACESHFRSKKFELRMQKKTCSLSKANKIRQLVKTNSIRFNINTSAEQKYFIFTTMDTLKLFF